ncbi:DNA polymerase zeta catalytic subunit isoform X1 [Helicoverpa zea]|uniref:DNA polymerase zeta catalytic subunit isoform X1 n=1 Tax=Helicoverpa zea TaxID=7113 RepID=UPI001F58AECA|nr:DNA polymerase zeta catalytic subunit isoform X1 [Helicoverpa zea]
MKMVSIENSSRVNPEFSVRIVVCDHYLTKPTPGIDVIYSDFRGSDIKQVPVLRIFGPTPDGHKACLHIHGVFPYFYIPCPTPNPQPQFLYQIAASLDKALNIALKQATSVNQHVYKISLVKGLPFYGYHNKEHIYLKVFLYSPGLVKQAVELCSNGAILGQAFQPHESHLNFTLQFFIDFNLFGMSNIDLQCVKFRKAGISLNSNEGQSPNEFGLKPESSCYYEADCAASHIINRQRIGKGDGIENPGLEEVWNQETERRKQLNISLASKSLSQGRLKAEETESHYKFENLFLMKMSNLMNKPVITENNIKPLELVQYPAESMEGTQLFNAVDVSVHLPDSTLGASFNQTLRGHYNETTTEDMDATLVDETLALNSSLSLHYSQVYLNTEDLDLVNMLQDMDEKVVEEDSVMGTPANADQFEDKELDDAEYSQIFDEETIILDPDESKDDESSSSPSWNDSFWEGANIPQLDGTFDDDLDTKKVRKRKMRPFKLGLSRPKTKKKDGSEIDSKSECSADISQMDEINESRETIKDISDAHLRRVIKEEPENISENSRISIVELVNIISNNCVKKEHQNSPETAAKVYDLENRFDPKPGPSHTVKFDKSFDQSLNDTISDCESPLENNKLGIMSFYDTSKIFNMSTEYDNEVANEFNDDVEAKSGERIIKDDTLTDKYDSETRLQAVTSPRKEEEEVKSDMNSFKSEQFVIITPKIKPPTNSYIQSSLHHYNIPKVKNPEPFYSDHKYVGDKVEIGQMILKVNSKLSRDQKSFDKVLGRTSIEEWRHLLFLQTNEMSQESSKPDALKVLLAGNRQCVLEPVKKPPTTSEIKQWLASKETETKQDESITNADEISKNIDELENSQALGLNEMENSISLEVDDKNKTDLNNSLQVTMQPDGSFLCFGSHENRTDISEVANPTVDANFLTVMLVEVHTAIRGDFNPDPSIDPIEILFLTVTNDCPPGHRLQRNLTKIIVVEKDTPLRYLDRCIFNVDVTYVDTENELLEKVIELVGTHDPDILCGYETEMTSWGYILERAQVLGLEIIQEVSRITEKYRQKRWRSEENDFEGRIIGRIMLNVWRLFRHEMALSSYSFENCMYEVLKERVPKYSYAQLASWWRDETRIFRWIPVEHYLTRLSGTVRMLDKLDIINRTSELARLFGLQWWEVLSRGSQFRVESLMLRAARPLNLVALSPTVKQRAAMRAPECLPLIFEPESRFYTDPVIVLDFQSLYPSMMIAYNYCFSTCIGRVQNIDGEAAYEFGAWRLRIPKAKLEALVKKGLVHWSPVGVGFVKSSVRRGVLPALLRRILAARQAVKKNMKVQTDEAVKKAMHSRQLGLKLIANVTYGYTAANFSGRMPCVEVGDSVVSKGRETLERAIKMVRESKQWNAKVIYGDTDSMFVLVPGGTRAEAFEIGQQIADAVTADNPSPVALKLEKVYQPCILQTKKRYVGYMYESADQQKPVYEAKGIETVRRDGCPAGVKLLQRALCELFDTGDMSRAKRSVMATLSRLADGSLPPQELFFTREYHGPAGYRPGASAPPNEIAKRLLSYDRRSAPRPGWRVTWQVTAAAPATALVRLARTPAELLREPALQPHTTYYAARVLLPPLHRCLSLLGVDVFKWWNEVGYTREIQQRESHRSGGIARYMWRERCAVCGNRSARAALCDACAAADSAQRSAATLVTRLDTAKEHVQYCAAICASCCGHGQSSACENTECPVLWRRNTAHNKLSQIRDVVAHLPPAFTRESLDF